MITRILVPTDFSSISANACKYAQALLQTLRSAQIKIVHAYMPNVETEVPVMATPVVDQLHVREAMLKDFCREMNEPDHELLVGFAADELVRLSEQYDLIVMGTTGENTLLNRWFGSVSSATAQRAACPVLLIPPDQTFAGFQRILYASSYDAVDKAMLDKLLDFNTLLNATVHFVHVRDTNGTQTFENTKEEIFRKLFAERDPTFAFEIAEVDDTSIEHGIHEYANAHQIDLIVMAHRQRDFWEGFFHHSQTREAVLKAKLPILVFHL